MKCNVCGQEYNIDINFCAKCGNKMTLPEPGVFSNPENQSEYRDHNVSQYKKKPGLNSNIIKIATIVVVIAVVIFFIFKSFSGSSDYLVRKDNLNFFSTEAGTVFINNNNELITIEGENKELVYDLEMSKLAILTTTDDETSGELWYIDGSQKHIVAKEVEKFNMVPSGNTIAYINNYDSSNYTGTLNLYDCSTKQSVKIADDVYTEALAVSPDGKSLGYVVMTSSNDSEFECYLKNNDKPAESFGDNKFILALSNNCNYIYYLKQNDDKSSGSMYVKKGETETKLSTSMISSLYLNSDYSEILFTVDGKTYISKDGQDKQKLSNSETKYFLLPRYTAFKFLNTINYSSYFYSYVYGVKTFAGKTFVDSDDKLIYINDKLEPVKKFSISNLIYANTNSSGKNVFYLNGEDLYRCDVSNTESEIIKLGENVQSYITSPDGSSVYFINTDQELWYVNNSLQPVKISDDVGGTLVFSNSGNKVFFLTDYSSSDGGVLNYSDNGRDKVKVAGVSDIIYMYSTVNGVFLYANYNSNDNTADIYKSNGNENFNKILEEAKY